MRDDLRGALQGGGAPARGLGVRQNFRSTGSQLGTDPTPEPALYRLPVDVHPPPDALNLELFGTLTTGSTNNVELAALVLSDSRAGVLRNLQFTVAGPLTTASDVRFTLEVAGDREPMVSDFRLPPATASSITVAPDPSATFVRLSAGARVRLLARAADGIVYTFSARALGWSWGIG